MVIAHWQKKFEKAIIWFLFTEMKGKYFSLLFLIARIRVRKCFHNKAKELFSTEMGGQASGAGVW